MDDFRIRKCTGDDHPAVVALVSETLRAYGFPFSGDDWERYDCFWVAELRGVVIGCVAVRKESPGTCELKRLYVTSTARGQGVGRALAGRVEAYARAMGSERLAVLSSRRFREAAALYASLGFVLVEELANDWEDNRYEKALWKRFDGR